MELSGRLLRWTLSHRAALLCCSVVIGAFVAHAAFYADLRDRTTGAEARINSLEREIVKLQTEAIAARNRRPPFEFVSSCVAIIGVRWTEDSGKSNYTWRGTGFSVSNSSDVVTAAHVVVQLTAQQDELRKRGLDSEVVVRFSDSAVGRVNKVKFHPRYSVDSHDRDLPSCDLALLSVDRMSTTPRLRIVSTVPNIGDEVFVVGFPQAIAHVTYPASTQQPFQPMSRRGHVERIVGVDDITNSLNKNLLQLGIPVVGGMSGSPVVNIDGEVVGVAIFASHRLLSTREIGPAAPLIGDRTRLLDPAHVSFAVSTILLSELLNDES